MQIRISPTIQNEWDNRCIADVIPALANVNWSAGVIEVDEDTAQHIARDCEFYLDTQAIDTSAGERSAYRALLRQVNKG